jgi:hypothetical protein
MPGCGAIHVALGRSQGQQDCRLPVALAGGEAPVFAGPRQPRHNGALALPTR